KAGTRRAGTTPSSGQSIGSDARITSLPAAGVYVYETTGSESTDALTGARHEYPRRTTMTLQHTACGFETRWQPLDQRWDDGSFCFERNGTSLRRFESHHEFFGKTDTQTFVCPAGSIVYPADRPPGRTWRFSCSSTDGEVSS